MAILRGIYHRESHRIIADVNMLPPESLLREIPHKLPEKYRGQLEDNQQVSFRSVVRPSEGLYAYGIKPL